MRDRPLRVAIGSEQLSGANAECKRVLSGERLEHLLFRERSDDVARRVQCLLQRFHFRLNVRHELAIEITLAQLQNL